MALLFCHCLVGFGSTRIGNYPDPQRLAAIRRVPDASEQEYIKLLSYSGSRIPLNFSQNSPIIDIKEVADCFRQASGRSYHITMYVKQPSEGTFATWKFANTVADIGHTFVKLSMDTYDGNQIERTVGFYPKNSRINPIKGIYTDQGVFRDDHNRPYDVSITFNDISATDFNYVLGYLDRLQGSSYDLLHYNATKVGLEIANKVGHQILAPNATWPSGGNDCPAALGQVLQSHLCDGCTVKKK